MKYFLIALVLVLSGCGKCEWSRAAKQAEDEKRFNQMTYLFPHKMRAQAACVKGGMLYLKYTSNYHAYGTKEPMRAICLNAKGEQIFVMPEPA